MSLVEKKGKKCWSRLRRTRWWLISLTIFSFLVMAATLFFQSNRFSSWLISRLNHELRRQLALTLEVDSLRFYLWQAKAEAVGLRVFSVAAEEPAFSERLARPPFLFIPKVSLRVALRPLLQRRLEVKEIVVHSPSLNFTPEKLFRPRFTGELQKDKRPKKASSWQWQVNNFRLEGGNFSYAARPPASSGYLLFLKNIKAALQFNEEKQEHAGWLSFGPAEIELAGKPSLPLLSSRLVFRFTAKDVFLEDLSLEAEGLHVAGSGSGEFSPRVFLRQGQVRGEIELEKMSFFQEMLAQSSPDLTTVIPARSGPTAAVNPVFLAPGSIISQGRVTFELTFAGEETAQDSLWPKGKAQIKLSGEKFAGAFGQQGNLQAQAELDNQKITLSSLVFTSPVVELSGEGFFSFDPSGHDYGKKAEFKLKARIEDLGYFKDFPLLAKFSTFPKGSLQTLAGALSLEASLTGSLQAPKISFELRGKELNVAGESIASLEVKGQADRNQLAIFDLRLRKTDVAPPFIGRLYYDWASQNFSASLETKPQNLLAFSSLLPSFPCRGQVGFNLAVRGKKDKLDISYKIDGNDINWKSISVPEFKAAGKVRLRGGGVEAATLAVDLRPSGFRFGLVEVETREQFQLSLEEGVIKIIGLDLQGNGVSFRAEGGIGLQESAEELVFEGKVPLALLASWLKTRATNNFSAQGELGVKGKISGTILKPEPEIEIRMADGSLSFALMPVPAEKINIQAWLQKEALELRELSFHLGQGRCEAMARIPLPQFRGSLPATTLDATLAMKSVGSGKPGLLGLKEIKERREVNKKIKRINKDEAAGQNAQEGHSRRKIQPEPALASELNPTPPGDLADKAQIKVSFWGLNPADFLPPMEAKFPPFLKQKVQGEISGSFDLTFLPDPRLDWLSSFQGEGRLSKLKLALAPLSIVNEIPLVFRVQPDLIIMEPVSKRKVSHPFKQPELDFFLQTHGNLSSLASFFDGFNLSGNLALNLRLAGALSNLSTRGSLELRAGSLELASFPLRVSEVTGLVFFSDRRVELSSWRGRVNAAPWEITGGFDLDKTRRVEAGTVELEAKGVPLEVEGMMASLVDLSLRLEPKKPGWNLAGDVRLHHSSVTAELTKFSSLMRRRQTFRRRPSTASPPSFLQDTTLNLRLNFDPPLSITNSLLQTEIHGALTLSGTLTQPVILGRLSNPGPGELTWAERQFRLEKMQVDFTGSFPPDPRLEVLAQTELRHGYDDLEVRLNLSGPVSELRLNLQSTPARSQEELAFILLFGKSLEEVRSQGLGAFREQIMLALTAPAAARVSSTMQRLFRLEEVRLEPLGIAGETDPGARMTLVKQITPAAKVTSSVDISNSQRQTWTFDYRLSRGMTFQGYRKDEGNYGVGLRHNFSLGRRITDETSKKSKGPRQIISQLEIRGEVVFPEPALKKKLGQVHPGKDFRAEVLDRQIKSLASFYRKKKYLQVKINPVVEVERENKVKLALEVRPGPRIELKFAGTSLSRSLRQRVEAIWARESNVERAAERVARLVEKSLQGRGYFHAKVNFTVKEEASASGRVVLGHFMVTEGPRYRLEEVEVEGAEEGRKKELLQEIKSWREEEVRGFWLLLAEPKAVTEAIASWYEAKGFLEAKASIASIREDSLRHTIFVKIKMEEGPLSRVCELRIEGNEKISSAELEPLLQVRPGDTFNPNLIVTDRNRLLAFYRGRGFRDIAVKPKVELVGDGPDIRVIYLVEEGVIHKVSGVEFSGIKETRHQALASVFGLKVGETLNWEKIYQGQKALYDTGDFSLVQVMTEPTEGASGQEKVRVELRPEPVANLRYGLRYDSELKTELMAGLDFRHLFGLGRQGMVNYLHNARLQDFRLSFHDRDFLGLKVDSLLSFYFTKKNEASFTTEEAGASWRHQLALPEKILLSTVVRRSRIHTYEAEPVGPLPFDISLSLTELSLQAVRDTRDDPLDSRRGSFISSSLTYSPEALKSELTYLSWFGQASFYRAMGSRLVFASNFRLGLATAFDQVMVPARRFYAGGGYSLRGFKQDMVGPYDPYLEAPEGGEAVFISNQELRLSLVPGIDGVLFFDAGNVFREVKDISLRQLRHTLGFGLRLRSPVGLLRLDLGFNLWAKPGEPRQVLFFSLGQIF